MSPRKAEKRSSSKMSNDSIESDDASEDYRKKRDRNNLAVKKSRVKSKIRTQETMKRVTILKQENSILEEKVNSLTKELVFLKDMFLAHASSSKNLDIDNADLERLLSDESTGTGFIEELNKKK